MPKKVLIEDVKEKKVVKAKIATKELVKKVNVEKKVKPDKVVEVVSTKQKEEKIKIKYNIFNLVEIITHALSRIVNDLGKYVTKKENENKVFVVLKLLLIFFAIAILKVPFVAIKMFGVFLIYLVGTTFRELLSSTWIHVVNYTYVLISLNFLYVSVKKLIKTEEYLAFYQDDNKKIKMMKNIGSKAVAVLRMILYFALLPLLGAAVLFAVALGMFIFMAMHNIYLISIFLIVISAIAILVSLFFLLYDSCFSKKVGEK